MGHVVGRQMSFPALLTPNVCEKSLIQTAGDQGFLALLLSKAVRICHSLHTVGTIAFHWASEML